MRFLILIFCCGLFIQNATAQEELANTKFGTVEIADFDLSKYAFDTTADAVVIAKMGETYGDPTNLIESPGKVIETRRGLVWTIVKKRIKILSEAGKKVANESIYLYGGQKVDYFQAASYHTENGKVIRSEMGKSDYRFDNENDFTDVVKMTIPNIRVGSIVEIEYKVSSIYPYYVPDWNFQEDYPTLFSSYGFNTHYLGSYYIMPSTIIAFHTNKQKGTQSNWILLNLPPKATETLNYDPRNYHSKLVFEKPYPPCLKLETDGTKMDWDRVCTYWNSNLEWYKPFIKKHAFLGKIVSKKEGESKEELAERIYYYVQQNYKVVENRSMQPQQLPHIINDKKKGSREDINLFLVSCLRANGIAAYPLLINPRGLGKPVLDVPVMSRLNYTACYARMNGIDNVLDATAKDLKFNTLPLDCYNGYAHVIYEEHRAINLSPDSIGEMSQTNSVFVIDNKNNKLTCTQTEESGFYNSRGFKKLLHDQGADAIKKEISKQMNSAFKLDELTIEKNPADTFLTTLNIKCSTDLNMMADKIYVTLATQPLFSDETFKPAKRELPIEFPYTKYDIQTTELIIPVGYKLIETPNSKEIALTDGKGSYTYIVEADDDKLTISTIFRLNRALFSYNEFDELKQFYSYIKALEEEIIVLSKK